MRILLAVAGPDQAYEPAKALAHVSPVDELIVLHVLEVPSPIYPHMPPETASELSAMMARGMWAEGERSLKKVLSVIPSDAGPVRMRLETGSPAEVILAVAEQEHVDLIVMGAQGVGPVRELILGSVSHRVLTRAPCPALVVKAPLRSLQHVLLAIERPEDADAAVAFLKRKPFRQVGEVEVFTVLPVLKPMWPASPWVSDQMEETALRCAKRFVEDVAFKLSTYGYCATAAATVGSPAFSILERATALEADLLLVGSRSRPGISRFLLGSVTHEVLHAVHRPVLVFR